MEKRGLISLLRLFLSPGKLFNDLAFLIPAGRTPNSLRYAKHSSSGFVEQDSTFSK
jgi:hypothetical protein